MQTAAENRFRINCFILSRTCGMAARREGLALLHVIAKRLIRFYNLAACLDYPVVRSQQHLNVSIY